MSFIEHATDEWIEEAYQRGLADAQHRPCMSDPWSMERLLRILLATVSTPGQWLDKDSCAEIAHDIRTLLEHHEREPTSGARPLDGQLKTGDRIGLRRLVQESDAHFGDFTIRSGKMLGVLDDLELALGRVWHLERRIAEAEQRGREAERAAVVGYLESTGAAGSAAAIRAGKHLEPGT